MNFGIMKKNLIFFVLFGLYILVFLGTSYRLYNRLGVFGCGDECINYTAAYFLNTGKALYTEVFFNRQPIMAYASLAVQWVTHPTNLYSLVLYHRLAFMVYAFIMGVFLIWRFRVPALLFLILYEGTKFYVYGYQFIWEAVIVYPLAYAFSATWCALYKKKTWGIDWYLVPLSAALVFWTREPYVPVAFALLVTFIWVLRKDRRVYTTILLSLFFCIVPYIWIPLGEYTRQVIEVNLRAAGSAFDIHSLLYAFGYPVAIFVSGKQSFFRLIQIGMMAFVGLGMYFGIRSTKKYTPFLFIFGILGLAAIRSVAPGIMYFEAFHMLPWFGLACMTCALVINSITVHKTKTIVTIGFIIFSLWAFVAPQAFIWEKVDKLAEFESQYAKYSHYSQAIKIITTPAQQIFLDMWDDVIYWESGRNSSYPYSLYIPVAAGVSPYKEARTAMFIDNPPAIYYSCPVIQSEYNSLPADVRLLYTQLLSDGKPSCLYVHNLVMQTMNNIQREELSRIGYTEPKVR